MTSVMAVDNQTGETFTIEVQNTYSQTILHHLKVDGCTVLAVVVAK